MRRAAFSLILFTAGCICFVLEEARESAWGTHLALQRRDIVLAKSTNKTTRGCLGEPKHFERVPQSLPQARVHREAAFKKRDRYNQAIGGFWRMLGIGGTAGGILGGGTLGLIARHFWKRKDEYIEKLKAYTYRRDGEAIIGGVPPSTIAKDQEKFEVREGMLAHHQEAENGNG